MKWSLEEYELVMAADRDSAIVQLRCAADLGLDPGPTEAQPFNLRQARGYAGRLAVRRALTDRDDNIAQAAELLSRHPAHPV